MAERILGPETAKGDERRRREGFYDRYLSGDNVLDIGYRGGTPDACPVTPKAIGVELDYPGYDGMRLPFPDNSQDAVFASHCLEHIRDYRAVLRDWFRVVCIGGFVVIAVPNKYLYERRAGLPSRFNGDHRRFYSPASLLAEVEQALPEGQFRVRSLRDVDDLFDYGIPPSEHSAGSYEIELVIEKIAAPAYAGDLQSRAAQLLAEATAELCAVAMLSKSVRRSEYDAAIEALSQVEMPHYQAVLDILDRKGPSPLSDEQVEILRSIYRDADAAGPLNCENYRARYDDIASKSDEECRLHWRAHGYFEGRDGH